jgi:chromosomal replication initiator protein
VNPSSHESSLSPGLDPRNTFDSYIVGTANRLAAAAAKRVAESPGAAYNPLFLYSESGLGKTHLIMAIGNHVRRVHGDIEVVYDTLEHLMEGVMEAIQAGERDAFRTRLRGASVLLLDDVQFLAGRRGAQEELLRSWDGLTARGGQVVLASDRPPAEIDGLDQRLLSRFSGGLMADLSLPDYETRVAIVRHKAEERGHLLSAGVAEALAKHAFGNVRELQGALNRIIAVQ